MARRPCRPSPVLLQSDPMRLRCVRIASAMSARRGGLMALGRAYRRETPHKLRRARLARNKFRERVRQRALNSAAKFLRVHQEARGGCLALSCWHRVCFPKSPEKQSRGPSDDFTTSSAATQCGSQGDQRHGGIPHRRVCRAKHAGGAVSARRHCASGAGAAGRSQKTHAAIGVPQGCLQAAAA